MMTYEMFKEVVIEKFKDYLPEAYRSMDMQVNPVEKINHTLDGITLTSSAEGWKVSPRIFVDHMYSNYLTSDDLQGVLQAAAAKMVKAMQESPQIPMLDENIVKKNIVFHLVNTEQNKELLKNMPHREFQDLSIIYRWVVNVEKEGIQNIRVDNLLASKLGLSEEQLFNLAAENTRRILPPCIKSMNEALRDMFVRDGMPAETADMLIGEMSQEQTMWVIANEKQIYGATAMLYEDKLHVLAEKVGTDLYILPSSVHEVIAVSVNMGKPEELAQMVSEINMELVALEDRLSNQVYHYDKELRKLTLATDMPNKALTGIVVEPPMVYEANPSR